jgi:hypothetical protein
VSQAVPTRCCKTLAIYRYLQSTCRVSQTVRTRCCKTLAVYRNLQCTCRVSQTIRTRCCKTLAVYRNLQSTCRVSQTVRTRCCKTPAVGFPLRLSEFDPRQKHLGKMREGRVCVGYFHFSCQFSFRPVFRIHSSFYHLLPYSPVARTVLSFVSNQFHIFTVYMYDCNAVIQCDVMFLRYYVYIIS